MSFSKTTQYDGIHITLAIDDMDLVCWTGRMQVETLEIKHIPVDVQTYIRKIERERFDL